MVKRKLPGNIYRCKGIVYAIEAPERRAIVQVVGRRSDVALEDAWDGQKPSTRIVAIAARGTLDDHALTQLFDDCIAD